MDHEISLSKPFLRKEMELKMKDICEGRLAGDIMLRESVRQYKRVFEQSKERLDLLKAVSRLNASELFRGVLTISFQSCRRYVLNAGRA
jgi:DNA topoisomerase-3